MSTEPRTGKWARRESPEGLKRRIGAWVKEDDADTLEQLLRERSRTTTSFIRDSVYEFLRENGPKAEFTKKRGRGAAEALARSVFRVLLRQMGAKEVLEEVLDLLPSRDVDRIVTAHREKARS